VLASADNTGFCEYHKKIVQVLGHPGTVQTQWQGLETQVFLPNSLCTLGLTTHLPQPQIHTYLSRGEEGLLMGACGGSELTDRPTSGLGYMGLKDKDSSSAL
jgi:hypothetical protein